MCGLVGVFSSNMLTKHKEVLETLLILDTFRGRDSTGVAAIRANADTHVIKSTVTGYEFTEGPKLAQHLRLNDFCWIGHNRFGTVGKNVKTNAHPFEILDNDGSCIVVGAHNGTLRNKHVLTDHSKFGTDSEALFSSIAFEGLEDTLSKVEGAWALTYYDHLLEELKLLRNKERPLFYAFEAGKKTLVWASEIWMIRVAMSRAGIKLDEDKVYEVKEDTLYSFPAPSKVNEELTFEVKEGVVGKQASAFFQTGQQAWTTGVHGAHNRDWRTQQETKTEGLPPRTLPALIPPHNSNMQSTTKSETVGVKPPSASGTSSGGQSSNKSDNVRGILSAKTFKGYGGRPLSKDELKDQLDGGCSWCEIEIVARGDKYAWLADGHPVCNKCLTDSHTECKTAFAETVH